MLGAGSGSTAGRRESLGNMRMASASASSPTLPPSLVPSSLHGNWPAARWLGVRMNVDMYDADFLRSLPYTEQLQAQLASSQSSRSVEGPAASVHAQASGGITGMSPSVGSAAGSTSTILEATCKAIEGRTTIDVSLWMADIPREALMHHSVTMLSHSLSLQCRQGDAFGNMLAFCRGRKRDVK